MNKFYFSLLVLLFSILGFDSTAQTNMYAVNNQSDMLIEIDTTTLQPVGAGVPMTDGGVSILGCNGLATHPVCGDLYIIYKMSGVTGRLLGVVNPTTGEIAQIGNTGDNVAAICFGDATHLYAVTGDGASVASTLFKVNMTTAAMTSFSTYGNGNDGECIAFNEDDGNIYHWSGNGTNVMEVTDTLTGVTTGIVESGDPHMEIFGATYIGNGNFLLSEITDKFFRVSSTGVATQLATGVSDYKGLAFPITSPPFNPVVTTADPINFCPGDSATLTASAGISYQWFENGIVIPGATSQSYEAMNDAEYYAIVGSPIGCLSNSDTTTITLFTSPNVAISPNDTTICPGATVLLQGANGGSLQWTLDGVAIPGATSSTFLASSAGLYNQIKTNLSGCSDSSAVGGLITFATIPVVNLTPALDTTFCPGDSVMLTGSNGGQLQWYMDGNVIPGATNNTYYASAEGIYNQLKTNTSGCSDSSAVGVEVTMATIPVVTFNTSSDTSYCVGDSILITGSNGGSLQWYHNGAIIPGATGNSFYVSTPGVYNQLKTNTSGCADSSAVGVSVVEVICDNSLIENNFNGSVKLYPSPVTDHLNIQVDLIKTGELNIVIYAMNGTIISTSSFNTNGSENLYTIPTSELKSGMYLIEISQGESRFVDRFMKN